MMITFPKIDLITTVDPDVDEQNGRNSTGSYRNSFPFHII